MQGLGYAPQRAAGHLSLDDISSAEEMQPTLDIARRAAGSRSDPPASVLLNGETGTGKEVLARAIHDESPRRNQPFVTVNCSSIPETLIESELFGFRRGAFLGADHDKSGKFMVANKGTLFLDEIGDMPMASQAKLLRALQTGEIAPLGEVRTHNVNVRIISATNLDLRKAVKQGKFREDLFYRLNVLEVSIPPLRERKGDIQKLADIFLATHARAERKKITGFSAAAKQLLDRHPWPGNVRELENMVLRAVIMTDDGKRVEADWFPGFENAEPRKSPNAGRPQIKTAPPSDAPDGLPTNFVLNLIGKDGQFKT
ncbi:MAG: sigma 54-interacting transcriptional regulator, partial [Pseudomonadota bacterium]|nr:sigma 54-interacting transcriptional regulator [Pseudomonadota bacterium]